LSRLYKFLPRPLISLSLLLTD